MPVSMVRPGRPRRVLVVRVIKTVANLVLVLEHRAVLQLLKLLAHVEAAGETLGKLIAAVDDSAARTGANKNKTKKSGGLGEPGA